jgi:hypothetical protein
MSAPKQLIPLSYLNEACFLSQNIDEKKFKMSLKIAQKDLRDILGGEFYAEIETQYAPANDTLTTENATLYEDYLKDFLAWSTYQYHLGFSQSESTPTGERAFKDENSDLLTDITIFGKEKNVKAQVSRCKNDIINYLRLQQTILSTNFPLWKDTCRDEFGFAISGIERNSALDKTISITKAVRANE